MRKARHALTMTLSLGTLLAGAMAGCEAPRGVDGAAVQQAVAAGAQGALAGGARRASAVTPEPRVEPAVAPAVAEPTDETEAVPEGQPAQSGLSFREDRDHQEIAQSAESGRTALAWTGHHHGDLYFGRVDGQGHAMGRGVNLHHVVDADEELVGAPSVVVIPGGYGVAWVDGDNGRVRFRRLDAEGRPVGRASIVHEGLEAPESVRLGWNGREFAVAVGLWRGVYFARVTPSGARIGDGAVVAEGEPVRSVDALRFAGSAWHVGYAVERNGTTERATERFAATRGNTASRAVSQRVM